MIFFAKATCIYAFAYLLIFWLSGINMLYWVSYGFAMSLASSIIEMCFIHTLVNPNIIQSIRKYLFVFEWIYFYVILLIKIFLSVIIWGIWTYVLCDGIFYWHHFVLICSFIVVNFGCIYKVSFSKVNLSRYDFIKNKKDIRVLVENDDVIICYMTYRQIKNLIRKED